MIEIKNSAIFIADSHYPHSNSSLLEVLNSIYTNRFKIPQIFLMGDIFDLLFYNNKYLYDYSIKAIKLINKLSMDINIYYLEGNHDFLLQNYFPNINIFLREVQPIKCKLNNKIVWLSHGDKYQTGIVYNIFSKIFRNKFTLFLLKPFVKKMINFLKKKYICNDINQRLIDKMKLIIKNYPKNSIIIEGHFHQGVVLDNYISLPSLVCQKKVAIVKDNKIIFVENLLLIE